MEALRRIVLLFFPLATLCCVASAHGAVVPGADPTAIRELPDGTILGKDNWEVARQHLPDEILELYKRGDYANPIRKLENKKSSGTIYDPRLKEISQKNAGRFRVDEKGTVVDKWSTRRPASGRR